MRSEIWSHCASVGFFGFLSLFPMMAVLVLIYGLAFSTAEMEAQVSTLRSLVPPTVYRLLDTHLETLAAHSTSHLTIGLIFSALITLYMSSRGIKYLIVLLNLAYRLTSSRNLVQRTMRAVVLTCVALVVFTTTLSIVAALPLLIAHLPFPRTVEYVALRARWPFLAGLVFLVFLCLYRLGPDWRSHVPKRVVPGAALATALWLPLSFAFSLYVQNFSHYSAVFGTLSAAVVLMLWIYYSAFIIAVGASFNVEVMSRAVGGVSSIARRTASTHRAGFADRLSDAMAATERYGESTRNRRR